MEIYLDTGDINEIKEAANTGMLSGVTTNPTLIAKTGRQFKDVIKDIEKLLGKHTKDYTVSAEVHSVDWQGMLKEAQVYTKWGKHVIIKLPMTRDGLIACKKLSAKKVKVNITLCFSPNQALLAAKAGAWCVSPFVGRIDDHGGDGMEIIEQIRAIFDNYNYKTKILVASIRHPGHVRDAAIIGADICTMPKEVFDKLYTHPLTSQGLDKFLKDYHQHTLTLPKVK